VNVTNLGEGGVYGSEGEITPDMFPDGSLMQTKVAFETQKKDSIMKALRDIPGVRVEVNADFDSTYEDTTRTVKPDPKPVLQRETSQKESSKQLTAAGGGRPGVTANGPNRQAAAPAQPENQSDTKNESTETQNVVGLEENRVLKKGFTPKEVWATVTIPSSYIDNLWKIRNPTVTAPPKPDDLRLVQNDVVPKVENIVEPLLIQVVNKGENTYKHVRVVVLDSLPSPAIAPPSFATTATSWIGRYWSTLAMLGVAMFSLVVLRSVVNGKSNGLPGAAASARATGPSLKLQPDEPSAPSTESVPASTNGELPENHRPRLRLRRGTTMKDDLIDIVREDPDTAANILRSWIGKAS
jgi:flagellar M-ring protein FliF